RTPIIPATTCKRSRRWSTPCQPRRAPDCWAATCATPSVFEWVDPLNQSCRRVTRAPKMAGMKDHFASFARYNAWANRRLYDAAAGLSDADYRTDRGAFFGSLHGTLNHLLTADWVWMHRFTGQGPSPTKLDAIQHERLGDLAAARE